MKELSYHITISKRVGNIIIFTCPHCEYEKRINLESGELKTTKGISSPILHKGEWETIGLQSSSLSLN